ncbi:protein O-mannosyl-transferase TMTC4-like [Mya arenaria]|uniref:protein O-mannosyl-transferase TMTC4-like n=1 Tax=Mya arenaria TaxID=6604 RepID=UPI0022DF0361|nr:protein O-mannosyl-transferase TMTC4-like [Mya arenaria]XP_052784496.1 protein O-mannosyl-transferase TMTC4-like [Mya arenaria]XP_052784497.1 protein O-mannosyl-transferase TMTC4-like [Mya arenaria]
MHLKRSHRYKNGYFMNGAAVNGAGSLEPDLPDPAISFRPNPENFLPIPRLKYSHAAALVFMISVTCFVITYNGDFVFDDSEAIVGNKDLLPDTPIANVFSNDFWGKKLDSKTSHKSYRPLTTLTFRWSYALAGGLNPLFFHIPNILLHAGVSVLLLRMFSILFGGYSVSMATGSLEFKAARSSLLCTILFAVHPIHTESVSGIVGRADLLCAVLFILSFLLYVKACSIDCEEKDDRYIISRPEGFSIVWLLASMCLCMLSVFCKEQGITVIGICSAYDIVVLCGVDLLDLIGLRRKHRTSANGNGKAQLRQPPAWLLSLVKRHLVLLCTGLLVILYRWRLMGSTPPVFQVFDNPHSFVNGTILRALNYNYLYSINMWLMLNPWWLCFDWSMGCVPVIESFTDPRILAAIVIWIFIGCLVWACLKAPITSDQRCMTMALALIIIPFLPASNMFFRVGFVIAERILYLSSIGFCMLVVLGVRQICSSFPGYAKPVFLCMFVLYGVFMARSVQRSAQWKHEMDLFTSGAHVCPRNAKVHYNIAKLNADHGNTDVAIERYRYAIELNPRYDQAMNNLGNILKDRNDLIEAELLLQSAVDIREEFAAAWMNLGIVKATLKKFSEAEKCYYRAITHRRKYPDCFYNLGNLYLDVKQYDRAIEAWTNATRLKPTHLNAWTNMAIVYDSLEKYDTSIEVGKQGLKYLPNEPQLYFNIGNSYGKISKFEESSKYFEKAMQLAPTKALYVANYAVLYHRWGKLEEAEQLYRKALALNPNEPNVQTNLAMLDKKKNRGEKTS